MLLKRLDQTVIPLHLKKLVNLSWTPPSDRFLILGNRYSHPSGSNLTVLYQQVLDLLEQWRILDNVVSGFVFPFSVRNE